jgi:hypothetical protein
MKPNEPNFGLNIGDLNRRAHLHCQQSKSPAAQRLTKEPTKSAELDVAEISRLMRQRVGEVLSRPLFDKLGDLSYSVAELQGSLPAMTRHMDGDQQGALKKSLDRIALELNSLHETFVLYFPVRKRS